MAARLDLPAMGVPASRARVELRYPAEWIPVYEELAPGAQLHLVRRGEAVLLLALLLLADRLLAVFGLARRRRWLLAAAVTLAAAFSPLLLALGLALTAIPLAALGALALLRRLHGLRLAAALMGGAVVAAVAVLLVAAYWSATLEAPREQRVAFAAKMAMNAPQAAVKATPEASEVAQGVAAVGRAKAEVAYQGLPARIDLPPGRRQTVFARELLGADAPRRVLVLVASARLVMALAWGAALLALAVGLFLRRDIGRGAREFAARLVPRETAGPDRAAH